MYTTRGPEIFTPQGKYFFTLNMAELRIQNMGKGQPDHFLEAIGAIGRKGPLRFLDCTCGFGADSIVAAFALPAGSVLEALEVSPVMAAVTGWGFGHFVHENPAVTAALRRIHLQCGDYKDYVRTLPDDAYDVIYFDPMFTHTVEGSCQFQPVRGLLDHDGLTLSDIAVARRKGRRVVIKGRGFKRLQEALPETVVIGGRYSRVRYAILTGVTP